MDYDKAHKALCERLSNDLEGLDLVKALDNATRKIVFVADPHDLDGGCGAYPDLSTAMAYISNWHAPILVEERLKELPEPVRTRTDELHSDELFQECWDEIREEMTVIETRQGWKVTCCERTYLVLKTDFRT